MGAGRAGPGLMWNQPAAPSEDICPRMNPPPDPTPVLALPKAASSPTPRECGSLTSVGGASSEPRGTSRNHLCYSTQVLSEEVPGLKVPSGQVLGVLGRETGHAIPAVWLLQVWVQSTAGMSCRRPDQTLQFAGKSLSSSRCRHRNRSVNTALD